MQQAHSLQSLTYRPKTRALLDKLDSNSSWNRVSPDLSVELRQLFADLPQLRQLYNDDELVERPLLEWAALQAAPQLRELTVVHMADYERISRRTVSHTDASKLADKSLIYKLAQLCAESNTLERLHVNVRSPRSMTKFRDPATILAVERSAKLLSAKNIGLKIFFQLTEGGLIPPFLYGEDERQNHLLFDSGSGGWQSLPEDVLSEEQTRLGHFDAGWPSDSEDERSDDGVGHLFVGTGAGLEIEGDDTDTSLGSLEEAALGQEEEALGLEEAALDLAEGLE